MTWLSSHLFALSLVSGVIMLIDFFIEGLFYKRPPGLIAHACLGFNTILVILAIVFALMRN